MTLIIFLMLCPGAASFSSSYSCSPPTLSFFIFCTLDPLLYLLTQCLPPLSSSLALSVTLSSYPVLTSNMYAGFWEGGKDTCQGDSGGLFVCLSAGQFVQVGITSFGKSCGREVFPAVYTQVAHYMVFIQEIVNSDTRLLLRPRST
uniref:trypsin n=1 Tax=Oncorhynchus tshawytscha TaxID=74940 RepID=A0AAZ3Q1P0_ONCTS